MKSKRLVLLILVIFILTIIFFKTNLFRNREIIDYNQGMENAIIDYMKENIYVKYHKEPKFEMYEGHKIFQVEKIGNRVHIYSYVLNEIHYLRDGEIGRTANLNPAVIILKEEGIDKYRVIDYKTPKWGEEYPPSVKSLFPEHIAEKILSNTGKINRELINTKQKIK